MPVSYSFSPEDDPEGVTAMFDPYSAWSLRYATGFDLSAVEDRDDPQDFNYMLTVSTTEAGEIEELPEPFHTEGETEVVPSTRARHVARQRSHAQGTFQALSPLDPWQNAFSALRAAPEASPPDAAPAEGQEAEEAQARAEEEEDNTRQGSRETLHFRAPLRKASIPTARPRPVDCPRRGLPEATTAIIGIIDDGLNPLHDAFADSTGGSRIDFAWVQDAAVPGEGTTVPFGRELAKAEIDAARAMPAPEADRLAALGLGDFTRAGVHSVCHRLSHGTHVASLAAGDGPDHLRLLTVQLPAAVTRATSGAFMSPFVMAGVAHILERARQMSLAEGFPIPVVINFSYSLSGGPHNGLHFLERAIDTLVQAHLSRLANEFPTKPERAEVDVVLPAGNRLMARGHAERQASTEGRAAKTALALPWRVQPCDESSNFLEIWMPRDASGLELHITPPGGTPTRVTGLGTGQAVVMHEADDPEAVIGRITLDRQRGNAGRDGIPRKKRLLIALAPSAMPAASSASAAPSGLWQVEVRARLSQGERIDAWIQRDEAPLGYRRAGLQSYFDDAGYQRWDAMGASAGYDSGACVVRRAGSLNGIATGRCTTVVGGTATRSARLAIGCAREGDLPGAPGYAPDPAHPLRSAALYGAQSREGMRQPDISAEGDRSALAFGVIGAGATSGSRVAMNGSSVAAPQVSRYIAGHFLGEPAPTPALWPDDGETEHIARLGARALPPQTLNIEEER